MACLGCCRNKIKPKYKRKVDDIFPANPEDGLVKSNIEKLVCYGLQYSEKLDRIGEYLASRLTRDVSRRRTMYVIIAMETMDQLLVSCHNYSLNLFVESFLKMVQKLLECDDLELQILATASFVKFSNIQEDTPSYHRCYDFFVSKFSSMCHSGMDNEVDRTKIRTAGLKGLQGVVRKTVSDELQVNIWEPIHMDKIVPSLLYNMHDPGFVPVDMESPKEEGHPAQVAENVFRDLICRASFGNIKAILKPVLVHMDNHKLWSSPPTFVTRCFKIIMYSVQQQYAHVVIQTLLTNLDSHHRSSPAIKVAMMEVLYESALIAAGASIGPSVLDVFNTLVKHLRISLDNKSTDETKRLQEKKFEEAIINTIGQFANNLPDYQKVEIMMFIMGKFPQFQNEDDYGLKMDVQLQTMLLKTLLKVATKYKTVSMGNAFPPEFLQPLLRMSLFDEPGLRIIVQEILHTLIDRHGNTLKLRHLTLAKDIAMLDLTIEKVNRQDILFMKKSGPQFYWHLLENIKLESNKVDNFEALYCTMALLTVETGCKDIVMELVRLALDMQAMMLEKDETEQSHDDDDSSNIGMTNPILPITHKCAIHSVVVAFFNLLSQICELPQLHQYTLEVIEIRRAQAPHLLSEVAFNRKNRPSSFGEVGSEDSVLSDFEPDGDYPEKEAMKDKWLFQQDKVSELLSADGLDVTHLTSSYMQKPIGAIEGDGSKSVSDIQSINIDVESAEGTPIMARKKYGEEVTVESLKKMLAEDSSSKKAEEEKRRHEIINTFRTAPFEEIVARSEAKSNHFHNKLNEILSMVSKGGSDSPGTHRKASETPTTVFDIQYPDLYVY